MTASYSADGVARALGPTMQKGGALLPRDGARDVFPLPVDELLNEAPPPRRRRQRLHRVLVGDALRALNWLAGNQPHARHSVEPMHRDVAARVDGLSSHWMKVEQPAREAYSRESAREALLALTRGRALYEEATTEGVLAPFIASAVSLPSEVTAAPYLENVLPQHARRYMMDGCALMRRPEHEVRADFEADPGSVYVEPSLIRNRRTYSRFVCSLVKRGLVEFREEVKAHVGVFFVWKKGKKTTRLILDCRNANRWLVKPPTVELLTSEGLANLELDVEVPNMDSGDREAAVAQAACIAVGVATSRTPFIICSCPMA